MNMNKKNLKYNIEDKIGTRLHLNLPPLKPIQLGEDIGTRLILNLPQLPPIFTDEQYEDETLENNFSQETLSLVRRQK